MCMHFSGLTPGRLANCVSTWALLRRSYIKLYDEQMSSSCMIDSSPTASRHSRGRRDQDQVAYINWHHICRLRRSKSASSPPKTRSNWMSCLQKAFSIQATSPKQHRRTPLPFPVSAMYSWDNRWFDDWPTWYQLYTRGGWYPNRTTRYLVITLKRPLHGVL